MKLHLGCGANHIDGYVNIDIRNTKASDMVADITDLKEFDDNTVDEIIGFHILEHIHFEKRNDVLKEWKRVLKTGGIVIMEVPDCGKLLEDYKKHGDFDKVILPFYGHDNFPANNHKSAYTRRSIKELFERNGFVVVSVGYGTREGHKPNYSIRLKAKKL